MKVIQEYFMVSSKSFCIAKIQMKSELTNF